MKHMLRSAAWRGAIFTLVCLTGTFALLAVFAELRFARENDYIAEFANISGLREGNWVRIAGVEVGKVKHISINSDNTIAVTFSAEDSVDLTGGTRALVRYETLLGGRYLELQEGAGRFARLAPGQTIPVQRTEPALDLDALIGGFRPLFRALDPNQINTLSSQLISVFQGEGATIGSVLNQTATLTSTLADRDELIGQVISNLKTVLASLANQGKRFDTAVDTAAQLISALSERRTDITNTLAYGDAAAATVADLLVQTRPAAHKTIEQADRTSALVMADRDYFDHTLATLPDAYQILARQGIYGDYFSFYLCDLLFKVNGKGGQPVYVKVLSQASGRCTPQ